MAFFYFSKQSVIMVLTMSPLQPLFGNMLRLGAVLCTGKASGRLSGGSGKYVKKSSSPILSISFS